MARKSRRWHEGGWNTYKEAYAYFVEYRRRLVEAGFRPGDAVPDVREGGPLAVGVLTWLWDGHPGKTGLGAVRYFTLHASGHGTGSYGFSAITDTGESKFSVQTALKQVERTHEFRVDGAFRLAVNPDTRIVKKRALGSLCPETGTVLDNTCDVDHAGWGFKYLYRQFLELMGLTVEQVQVDELTMRRLADPILAGHWVGFHRQYAQLEAVSKEGHRLRTERRRSDPRRQ